MPMPRPAAVAIPNELSPPSSAAASAGMTSRLVVAGSSPAIGSIRITARPVITEAITQFSGGHAIRATRR